MILRGILRAIRSAIGVVEGVVEALFGVGETLVAGTLLGLLVVPTLLLAVGLLLSLVLLPLLAIGVGIWVVYRIVSSERERVR